jgi:hypothetical protein
MDIFNPANMVLARGGARKIEIIEYTIKCVFQIPSKGNDPPLGSDESAKNMLADKVLHLFPKIAEPKRFKILPKKVATIIHEYNTHRHPKLDDDLCLRLFFMVLTSNFLTPSTTCYLKPVDALWYQSLEAIAGYNWCKIVRDNLRRLVTNGKVTNVLDYRNHHSPVAPSF